MSGVDLLTVGEALVSLRSSGPLLAGGPLSMHLAGAESNVAIGLARLGHRAAWVGRVGGDELGEFVLRQLRAEGVDTTAVRRDPARPTGLMFLERRTADVSRVQYHRAGSAGSALTVDDLRGPLAAGPRMVHLTGITPALSDSAREAAGWAARAAADAGIPVCLDVNHRAGLWSREAARATLFPLAGYASVVVASTDELDLVAQAGADEAAAAAGLLRRGVRTVLVKLGADGVRAYTAEGVRHVAAVPVTAVDTVGAGDAFTAGYLSGHLDGLDLVDRLGRAVTLGAFAVAGHGDWEGLPRRDELSLITGSAAGTTLR
ncbi:2-dehydro-3-deoxygluconokinase [Micromonospora phaseoli]|uniref:2-dehydro-3-deoxygluconokinase n=1 Tax=Micromonospora phaseoli TaxID=1144548 RepID=A0A1H6Y3E6_9ACTN|nr:sugar kinase [Micromonospora phaseoli]PZW00008.1 2-dehydro-3-deoxygluconokinase [Micromonospora phaseoli]GIJ80452.1 ribokinase [Micromonospora phaseoli]SEJ35751.1 2-dehydro-3-deoxygluconokinase [Micromonospora phaseoli]